MLSTIKIVSGADGTSWSDDQRACVLEVRSEHKLNDLTSFSILMYDIPDRREDSERRLLAVGNQVAVLVRVAEGDDWQVLFKGKVTEIETHETQGGVGSTILYKGVDIRSVMAGRHFTGSWSGQVDDVMEQIIKLDFSNTEVDAPENNTLDPDENPLAQNSNNLDFVRDQAVAYGFNFWVSYATIPEDALGAALEAITPGPPTVTIEPTIHWGQSPYLQAKLGELVLGEPALNLPVLNSGDSQAPIDFNVHVNSNSCPNVMSFEVTSDGQEVSVMEGEQDGAGLGASIPAAGANPFADPGDPDAPVVFFVPKAVQNNEEDDGVNIALETARGFNKRVKLSTTLRMIERIIFPHELGVLNGVAEELSGILFRVSETVHVIRIDDHFMDAVLESDGEVPASSDAGNLLEGVV